jgi:tetratricopeptide (TPR) repeat protein
MVGVVARARACAERGNLQEATRLLAEELEHFSGEIGERRRIVALLTAYCGRQERISEGLDFAASHLDVDPSYVMDSPIKARIIMNYAAMLAASGDIATAMSTLTDLIASARPPFVLQEDIARSTTMLESLKIAQGNAMSSDGQWCPADSWQRACIATARTCKYIEDRAFPEAVRLSRETLADLPELEDGNLKATLLLNLGVALKGVAKAEEAMATLKLSYETALRAIPPSGTLFSIIARTYAISLRDVGLPSVGIVILRRLLGAQRASFGADHPEIIATESIISQLKNCS